MYNIEQDFLFKAKKLFQFSSKNLQLCYIKRTVAFLITEWEIFYTHDIFLGPTGWRSKPSIRYSRFFFIQSFNIHCTKLCLLLCKTIYNISNFNDSYFILHQILKHTHTQHSTGLTCLLPQIHSAPSHCLLFTTHHFRQG